jgi:hypothetical protein
MTPPRVRQNEWTGAHRVLGRSTPIFLPGCWLFDFGENDEHLVFCERLKPEIVADLVNIEPDLVMLSNFAFQVN